MAIIGKFKLTPAGHFIGEINTLTGPVKASIEPTHELSKKAPAFRIFIGGYTEIGIAFERTSKKGNLYYAAVFDAPTIGRSFWANLVNPEGDKNSFDLMWDRRRPEKKEGAADPTE